MVDPMLLVAGEDLARGEAVHQRRPVEALQVCQMTFTSIPAK